MKTLTRFILIITTIFMLVGCGEPKLDTSSTDAMNQSVEKIMATLSKQDQQRFKQDLVGIYMVAALSSGNASSDQVKAEINAKLDGKTAQEVFQMADQLRDEMNNAAE